MAQHKVRWTSAINLKDLDQLDRAIQEPVDMSQSGGSLECFRNPEAEDPADCRTCSDYFNWIDSGNGPANTYQITMESWFKIACLPLKFLRQAIPAQKSYWEGFDLEIVPLPELVPLIEVVSGGLDWKRKVDGKDSIILESEGDVLSIEQLAWGDFNRDGNEDSVFYLTYHVGGGTLRYYTCVVVTRKSQGGPLQILTELK